MRDITLDINRWRSICVSNAKRCPSLLDASSCDRDIGVMCERLFDERVQRRVAEQSPPWIGQIHGTRRWNRQCRWKWLFRFVWAYAGNHAPAQREQRRGHYKSRTEIAALHSY